MEDSFEYHEYDISRTNYEIKLIEWSETTLRTPILLQDKNGPCPLIALVNTLVLHNAAIKNTCGSSKKMITLLKD